MPAKQIPEQFDRRFGLILPQPIGALQLGQEIAATEFELLSAAAGARRIRIVSHDIPFCFSNRSKSGPLTARLPSR
jgi:hypothetical protein